MKDESELDGEGTGKREDRGKSQPNLYSLAGAGFEFAAAIIAMTLLGWWLDGKWGTGPWLLITGAGLGFFGGMYNMLKQFRRYM